MKIRLEAEGTGEYLCDLDMKDVDIDKLISYAKPRLEKKGIKVELPLTEVDVISMVEFAIKSILEEEVKEKKKGEK